MTFNTKFTQEIYIIKIKIIMRRIIKTLASKSIGGFGVLLMTLTTSHYYGLEVTGEFMLSLSIIVGIGVLARSGMDNALIRDLSVLKDEENYKKIIEIIIMSKIWCVFISILFMVAILFAGSFESLLKWKWLYVSTPIYACIYLQASILKSFGLPEIAHLFEGGIVALFYSISIIIINANYQIPNIDIIFAINTLFIYLFGLFVIYLKTSKFFVGKIPDINEILKFPWKKIIGLKHFFILSVAAYIVQWGLILILGNTLTEKEVGQFSLSHRISLIIGFVLISINSIYAPKFSVLYNKKKYDELQLLVDKTFWVRVILSSLLYIIVVISAVHYNIISGNNEAIINMIVILGLIQLMNAIGGPINYLMMMTKNERVLMNYNFIHSLILILLAIITSKYIGLNAFLMGFLLLELIKILIYIDFAKKRLGFNLIPFLK